MRDSDAEAGSDSPSNSGSPSSSKHDDLDALLEGIYDHLEATEELPVDSRAGRWLGEAQAVAADLTANPPESVVERRAGQLRHLLESVGETDNPEVDEHVAAALELVDAVECRFRD